MKSRFPPVKEIRVSLDFGDAIIPVGRLAVKDRSIYFEYTGSFVEQGGNSRGIHISPFRLPLRRGVSTFGSEPFEGLPGVFNDSLPDGWGRLLMDRFFRAQGLLFSDITPLDRLAAVGKIGLGALIYEPDNHDSDEDGPVVLDLVAKQSQKVLLGDSDDVIDRLLSLNGSSAGARPKALIGVDNSRNQIVHGVCELPDGFEHWLVKFTNANDTSDAGAIEYVYALMAQDAGVSLPEVHLFPAKKGAGYFAVKRFDREGKKRLHAHTACGLLHSDFRIPALDYRDLVSLTGGLTRDVREVKKLFQIAVFNVLSHNRDDHSKNFSFLMNSFGEWKLSPAYDLTFSSGPRGEQSTMVMGEGRQPTIDNLEQLGQQAQLSKETIFEIIERTREAISRWPILASEYGVLRKNVRLIGARIGVD